MCGTEPTLVYSPRRLVALVAAGQDGGAVPGNGAPGGGTGGGAGGSAAPEPPASGPDPKTAWRNLMAPMPLGRKIRLTVRNTVIKIKTHQHCCGHPGEPGC